MAKLLSIDDDRSVHHLVRKALIDLSLDHSVAKTADEGIAIVDRESPDVVLLDVMLPDMSGLEAFRKIRSLDRRLPIIVVTAATGSDIAIEAMKLGAFDCLAKPIDVTELRRLVGTALESRRLSAVPVDLSDLTRPSESGDAFVGRCPAMRNVFKAIGRVAPQDLPVLIRGESGTGKELVARAIYQHGSRSEGPFLAVNCAALSETLLESELFGHEKGAFTGAHERRIGKFEQCDGGTLFLDEVGDMAPSVQSKVLRLLQEQTFERVGGNRTLRSDVRIVSATHRDLETMCDEGAFRSDLFYRLNGYTIRLPPLRERDEDRTLLLQHFLAYWSRKLGREVQGFSSEAVQALLDYSWPGNVRELQSVVRHALLQSSTPVLLAASLPDEILRSGISVTVPGEAAERDGRDDLDSDRVKAIADSDALRVPKSSDGARECPLVDGIERGLVRGSVDLYAETLAVMERELLTRVLTHARGNQSEAARILGITRGSLRNKLRSNGISIGSDIRRNDS
ncbi:MAG TPA: sigma-54 dependent transcriptional regulator [Pirellulaceae bacterium]|nr:sigma-54 dependent transcriptional regulator [Pirellulaceae bacterium]